MMLLYSNWAILGVLGQALSMITNSDLIFYAISGFRKHYDTTVSIPMDHVMWDVRIGTNVRKNV